MANAGGTAMILDELLYSVKLLNPMEIVKMDTTAKATIYRVTALTTEEGGEWRYNISDQPVYLNSNQLFVGANIFIHTLDGKCKIHSMKLVTEQDENLEWDIVNGFRKNKEE